MIVSHKHKFIFVKTLKTAGTSFEIALSEICRPDDIVTPFGRHSEAIRTELGFTGPQNTEVPKSSYNLEDKLKSWFNRSPIHFYNHTSAKEAKRWIGEETWNSYYKFCFDRHPYDKVVSHFYWRGGEEEFGNISNFIGTRKVKRLRGMLKYGIDGEVAVDQIYKFEELKESLGLISKKISLDQPLKLPEKKAKSHTRTDKRHYSEILSDKDKQRIQEIFADEFERFGYDPT